MLTACRFAAHIRFMTFLLCAARFSGVHAALCLFINPT
jgi:hypothetical protein